MSRTKLTPRQLLWIAFTVQAAVSLLLFLGAIYFQVRENRLIDRQPAMQASEQRARARIQNEHDIEQLRAAALHMQDASDVTWNAVIRMMRDLDVVLWGLFFGSLGVAVIGGYTVFVFRVDKAQPNQSLEPTAVRHDAHI